MNMCDEKFKKKVIDHVNNGRYSKALNKLNTKVQGFNLVEAIMDE